MPAERATRSASGRQVREPLPKDWHLGGQHAASKYLRERTQTVEITGVNTYKAVDDHKFTTVKAEAELKPEVQTYSFPAGIPNLYGIDVDPVLADPPDVKEKVEVKPEAQPLQPLAVSDGDRRPDLNTPEPAVVMHAGEEAKPDFPGVYFPKDTRIVVGLDGVEPELADAQSKEEEKPEVAQAPPPTEVAQVTLPTDGLQVHVDISVASWEARKPRLFAQGRAWLRARKAAKKAIKVSKDAKKAAQEARMAGGAQSDDSGDSANSDERNTTAIRDPVMELDDDEIQLKAEPVEDDDIVMLRSAIPVPVFDVDAPYPFTHEEVQSTVARLHNPNAKIKKDRELEDISIHARLNSIGLDWYPIPDGVPKNHLFNRLHLTYLYGGGFVETCPIISQDKSSVHGRTDFAFFSLEFNPHAPTHPGAPGLSLSETPDDSVFEHLLVFTLIKSGQWLHVGHYRFTPSQSLTREEYVMQKPQMKTRWALDILSKGWGKSVAARVYLRKTLGRNPTKEEEREVRLRQDTAWKKTVSVEDIIRAYSVGEEKMGIHCMKCIGYDADFQNFIVSTYPQFLQDEKVRKREREAARQAKQNNSEQRPTRSQNRQRGARKAGPGRRQPRENTVESESASSETPVHDVDVESDQEDDVGVDEQVPAGYKSKGTRSRPTLLT